MCITEQVSTNLKEFNFIQKNSMTLMELVWGKGEKEMFIVLESNCFVVLILWLGFWGFGGLVLVLVFVMSHGLC